MTQAMSVVALLVALPAAVSGLRTPVTARARVSTVAKTRPVDLSRYPLPRIDDPARAAPARFDAGAALAAAVLALELSPAAAFAKDGAYGLLEKKAPALVHPAIMLIVFVVALNAAFTGFQWRQLRELGTEVNALKAELKPLSEKAEASESVPAALASQISELEAKIKDASALRSDLQSKNLRDTHWQTGSVLLGIGTAIAIEGPVNTFMRAGKLFPGPHLYAGAGCVVMWALAASLVPHMQKGNDSARSAHIALNTIGLGLFAWQLPTGFDIVTKVWAKVPW